MGKPNTQRRNGDYFESIHVNKWCITAHIKTGNTPERYTIPTQRQLQQMVWYLFLDKNYTKEKPLETNTTISSHTINIPPNLTLYSSYFHTTTEFHQLPITK